MRPARLVNETPEYAKKRDELLTAELALREQIEAVAAQRRALPPEDIDDFVFHEGPMDITVDGPIREVRLTELFDDPAKPLVVDQYMFGGAQKKPCPMCTLWVDGYSGITRHIPQVMNFAVIAEAPIEELRAWGRERGWRGLRLVSSAGTKFKNKLQFQDAEGHQMPGMSVFVRGADGSVKHSYSNCALMKSEINRGMDLLSPLWNLLDLTPSGRGGFNASFTY